MDAMGFGMGCCCLQITFQACSINEARRMYDALVPVGPIMVRWCPAETQGKEADGFLKSSLLRLLHQSSVGCWRTWIAGGTLSLGAWTIERPRSETRP